MKPKGRWTLVLAGGDGTRLRDLAHEIEGRAVPKQYCRILGDRSLLEATLARTRHFADPAQSMVIVNQDHLDFGGGQLVSLPQGNVVVQPCNRDTGPGVLLGLLALARRDPGAVVAVMPSDHYVGDDAAFMRYVEHAAHMVARRPGKIALLGILPDEPDPEMGYVEPAGELPGEPGVHTVRGFVEKPSVGAAARLIAGGALWNSFVMVFRVARMLRLLGQVVPEEFERMRALLERPWEVPRRYPQIDAWNFSQRFLSRIADHLIVIRVEGVHWSDWGTRTSIERTLRKLEWEPPWRSRQSSATAVA